MTAPPQPSPHVESAPPMSTKTPVKTSNDSAKVERRKYALSMEDIKRAENALSLGQFERAVAFSDMAYKTSQDGRIFRAMIEVHVRAAQRRPAAIPNFEDERRWLVCALQDDP